MREAPLRKQTANLDRVTSGFRFRDPDAGPGYWRLGARCQDRDPDQFFVEARGSSNRADSKLVGGERRAVAVCALCPVMEPCLADALEPTISPTVVRRTSGGQHSVESGEPFAVSGVWGAT